MADETERMPGGEPSEPGADDGGGPRVGQGSSTGAPGLSATPASDFRASPEDVGAGTGVAGRDAGEEGEPASLEATGAGTSELTDDSSQWSALASGAMTEEGAAGAALRDEQASGEGAESTG